MFILFTGRGVKRCSFQPQIHDGDHALSLVEPATFNSSRKVFSKTLSFFCALVEHGCVFDPEDEPSSSESDSEDEESHLEVQHTPSAPTTYEVILDCRSRLASTFHCKGKMFLFYDKFNQPYIQ